MKRLRAAVLALLIVLLAFSAGAEASPVPDASVSVREAFAEAAFRAEYDTEGTDSLRRWEQPILIWAGGAFTEEDLLRLNSFVGELNSKVDGLPPVSIAETREKANLKIRFAPLAELGQLDSSYVEGNWGYFAFWYDEAQVIYEAGILVASDVTSQRERNHLLLEELVGALGLPNDLDNEPDSILYQSWTTTQELSALDWQLLNLVYDADLRPGMTWAQAQTALAWD